MADMVRPTDVLVVDDHPLLRDGLSAMLAAEHDMRVVGEAEDGEQAVACYTRLRPDVVLMDLQMPRVDGVEAIQRIRQVDSAAKVIVLTTYTGDVRAVRASRQAPAVTCSRARCAVSWSTPSATCAAASAGMCRPRWPKISPPMCSMMPCPPARPKC